MSNIRIELTANPKQKPQGPLHFGRYFTDHMFLMNYDKGEGWHDARIVPYGPFPLDPAAMCLHYGQEVFEGMKAYLTPDGTIQLFRPDENFKRLNCSNERICIPQVDEELCLEGLKKLIEIDKDWMPTEKETSLYIRPFIIATDAHVGVCPGEHYLFAIIVSPVAAYYETGLDPVKIYVEKSYTRAVKGGTGMAKTGGNYAASLIAQVEAYEEGFSQALWLDGVEKKYVEEVGTMNVFFVVDDEVITPALNGSILSGITRKSSIDILKSWGVKVTERRIAIDEIVEFHKQGRLKEMFGTGTAAVISPVGMLRYDGHDMPIGDGTTGALTQKLYDALTGIQWGTAEDTFGWTVPCCKL